MKTILTTSQMLDEAKSFAEIESTYAEPSLFGVTDGKAVGTYIELDTLQSSLTAMNGDS